MYQGKLRSLKCPVVLTSRPHAMIRGPMAVPSAMACLSPASVCHGEPAPMTPVNPQSSASRKLRAERAAARAGGASSPNGPGTEPRLW